MMGPTHRLFGGLCGVTAGTIAGQTWPMIAMTGLVATATAHGWSSPDVDQTKPWVAVRKMLPGGLARVMNHRGITHWWGLPAFAAWGITHLPAEAHWPAYALLVGWVSHLIGDALFGEVPLLPWDAAPRAGVGLRTGGRVEAVTKVAVALGVVWFLLAPPALPTYQSPAALTGRTAP